MTKQSTGRRLKKVDSSAANVGQELQSLAHEKYGVAVVFRRTGEDIAKIGSYPALTGGFVALVAKTWRSLESADQSPAGDWPAILISARFSSRKWDSPAVRARLQEILSAFFRGHNPLPGVDPGFKVEWYRLKGIKEVDAAIGLMKTGRGMVKKRPAPAPAKEREPEIGAVAAVAQLEKITAELERVKQPFKSRLQQVLDGLADQAIDSVELNAQVVRQINTIRSALGVSLRLKSSGDPIYLRCILAPRSKAATIQAVTADQKRTNLAASAAYPPLELFESEENS